MKITELAIREAEPNYEANPAQARLSAIAVKLMDKSKETELFKSYLTESTELWSV